MKAALPALRGLLAVCAFGLAGTFGSLQAQEEYHVTGIVQDTAGAPISGAMVVALTAADSVLAKFALTTGEGGFRLGGLPVGAYILQVTLIGHQTVRRPFELAASDIDAGVVTMRTMVVEMDPLVVSVEQVPFVVRRDTLSYNVAAFETPPNAMVEDLLKRLPGIDVDNDGTITAQGEEVENVLVDGREFFGPDPTIATRNLPADAVRQVDVFDKQSDMAEFTGIPDGDDERTIDLRLHEDARAGRFGRLSGGFGQDVNNEARIGEAAANDLRYEGRLNINRFSPTMQLSLAGNTDNVNRENFAAGELFSALGALGRLGGLGSLGRGGFGGGSSGGPGFTESLGVGLNANRDFDDLGWIRSSYFLSRIDNQRDQLVQEQTLFGENVASRSTQTGANSSARSSHRVNLNAEYSPSSRQRLRLRATVRRGLSDASSLSERTTVTGQLPPLNRARTENATDGEEWRGNAQVTWMRRLGDEGGSIVAELRGGIEDSGEETDHRSTITSAELGGGEEIVRSLVQRQESDVRTLDNSLRLSLTQPLGERYTIEAFGRASGVDQLHDQVVSDMIDGGPVRNPQLSSGFERLYSYLNAGARFSRQAEESWITVSVYGQRSSLDGTILDRDTTISSGYTHLLGEIDLKWQPKESHTISMGYNTSTREPSLNELQPFVDNRDPTSIYIGNPDLRPEYSHRLSADYRFFDAFSFVNLFASASVNYTGNPIARERTFDERGVQTVTPINTDPEWAGNSFVFFGSPVRRLGVDVDVRHIASYSSGWELINGSANRSRTFVNMAGIGVTNRSRDVFEVRLNANFTFHDVDYSLNQDLSRSYVNSEYAADGTLYLGGWTITSSLEWTRYDDDLYGQGAGSGDDGYSPGRDVALLNASITRRLRGDRVEVALSAFDLLNQNQAVSISSSGSFIQESRTKSLGQHVMLRLTYRLGMSGGGRGRSGGPSNPGKKPS